MDGHYIASAIQITGAGRIVNPAFSSELGKNKKFWAQNTYFARMWFLKNLIKPAARLEGYGYLPVGLQDTQVFVDLVGVQT